MGSLITKHSVLCSLLLQWCVPLVETSEPPGDAGVVDITTCGGTQTLAQASETQHIQQDVPTECRYWNNKPHSQVFQTHQKHKNSICLFSHHRFAFITRDNMQ